MSNYRKWLLLKSWCQMHKSTNHNGYYLTKHRRMTVTRHNLQSYTAPSIFLSHIKARSNQIKQKSFKKALNMINCTTKAIKSTRKRKAGKFLKKAYSKSLPCNRQWRNISQKLKVSTISMITGSPNTIIYSPVVSIKFIPVRWVTSLRSKAAGFTPES